MPLLTRFLARRAGPVGVAFTLYDIWRRIPAKQRKRLLAQARKQAPRVASSVARKRPPKR